MSFLEVLKSVKEASPENCAYTRPWQLPVNVKFNIIRGERVKKNNSTDYANRVVVECSEGIHLWIYISGKWSKLTNDDFEKMNNEIKKGTLQMFLVSRGGVSLESVVLDLLTKDDSKSLPLFDVSEHSIKKCDSNGKPLVCENCKISSYSSPGMKRQKSNE